MNELKLSQRRHFVATAIFVFLVFGLPLSALLVEEMRPYTGVYMHPYLRHDVAVTDVASHKNVVGQGFNDRINVTVSNEGDFIETFNVTTFADAASIEMKEVTLASGDSATITFTWNTTGFAYGNYTISATADQVPGETDIADNTFVDGWVVVTIPGDVNGDGKVDHKDLLLLASAYGSAVGNPRYIPEADINCNGKIDHRDLLILAGNYGKEA